MEALLMSVSQAILALVTDAGTAITNPTVDAVIEVLEKAIPFVETVGLGLVQPIQQAISLIEGNDALTADQVAAIASLKAGADAAYQKAWAAYTAAHPDPS
jgi:hypothetical protein